MRKWVIENSAGVVNGIVIDLGRAIFKGSINNRKLSPCKVCRVIPVGG